MEILVIVKPDHHTTLPRAVESRVVYVKGIFLFNHFREFYIPVSCDLATGDINPEEVICCKLSLKR